MQITSQHILEVLFKRTPYADTFRYIQNIKPKQIRFQDIFYISKIIFYVHIRAVNGFSIFENLMTNILLCSIFQISHLKQHLNYPNFSIQTDFDNK